MNKFKKGDRVKISECPDMENDCAGKSCWAGIKDRMKGLEGKVIGQEECCPNYYIVNVCMDDEIWNPIFHENDLIRIRGDAEMKEEIPIGERFIHDGVLLEVVEKTGQETCRSCHYMDEDCCTIPCTLGRADKKHIILKKVEEEGKNMEKKYCVGKTVSIAALFQEVPMCDDWRDKIVKEFGGKYGFTGTIPEEVVLEKAREWGKLDWLVKNGFIEEEKETRLDPGKFSMAYVDDCSGYVAFKYDGFTFFTVNCETGLGGRPGGLPAGGLSLNAKCQIELKE